MLSGVVLAGGRGSRIGGDKGLMNLVDRPMVVHVVDALSVVAEDITVSVGGGCGSVYQRVLGARIKTVEDRAPGRGPIEGLSTAFGEAEREYVAVVPCDVPLLRTEVIDLLARRAVGSDGAVPVIGGFLEPLVAVYRREAGLKWFAEGVERGARKVGDAVGQMDIREVDEDEIKEVDGSLLSFWNVNSKEDLEEAGGVIRRGVIPPRRGP